MNPTKSIAKLAMLVILGIGVSACSDDDDDDEKRNFSPRPNSLSLTTQTEVPIVDTLTATDPEGDMLSFALIDDPMLGSVTLTSAGAFTYQPFNELTGSDSFTFTVTDTAGNTTSGFVNIEIEALEVSVTQFTRDVFMADEDSEPARINGKVFIQDSSDPADFQDLLDNN